MHDASAPGRGGRDCLWHVQGLFLDERTARDAATALGAHGFDAGEIEILNQMDLSPVAPTEVWPRFEWKLAGGVLILFAAVAWFGFARSAVIALAIAGAVALGAAIGTRAALAEDRRLRATLARGGALVSVSVHDTGHEDCARETLSRFRAAEIRVQDFG